MSTLSAQDPRQSTAVGPEWDLVLRVAASPGFERSAKLRAFLLYVCERALQHRPEEITEQQIGVHVFGRASNYNPGDDNIVRAQARVMRWKLDKYFTGEGTSEPITIVIPKGAYVPVFETRGAEISTGVSVPVRMPAAPLFGVTPAILVLLFVIVILSATCSWLLAERRTAMAVAPASTPFGTLWNSFLGDNKHTVAVVPDEMLGLLQIASGSVVPLNEYIESEFPQRAKEMSEKSGLNAIIPDFVSKDLTFMSSVADVSFIAAMPRAASATFQVRSAHVVNMNELSSGNAILIGTAANNPWIQLFDKSLNFEFGWNQKRMNYCINRHPKPGEQAEYDSSRPPGFRTVYSGIDWLPSLKGRGDVLLILGTGPGNKAAAEFIANEKLSGPWLARFKAESGRSKLPYFEMVLRTTVFKTEDATTRVEAYRILPAEIESYANVTVNR
jgi:hypothetical protein